MTVNVNIVEKLCIKDFDKPVLELTNEEIFESLEKEFQNLFGKEGGLLSVMPEPRTNTIRLFYAFLFEDERDKDVQFAVSKDMAEKLNLSWFAFLAEAYSKEVHAKDVGVSGKEGLDKLKYEGSLADDKDAKEIFMCTIERKDDETEMKHYDFIRTEDGSNKIIFKENFHKKGGHSVGRICGIFDDN